MKTFRSDQNALSTLVVELSKLPGIGQKTATRLSHFILKSNECYAKSLADAILNARQKTQLCQQCFIFCEQTPCEICSNPKRNSSELCVVERPSEVITIEQTKLFHGLYHVLHGSLSPLEGVGPEELKIQELVNRIQCANPKIQEIIFATNSNVEGEVTTLYLKQLIQPFGIKMTQLAHGLPVGGLLEYTDRQTMSQALKNRLEIF